MSLANIKLDENLYRIRKSCNFDNVKDKFNLDLLEFLFCAYGRHGLLPISDLVDFIEKNNLKIYLEKNDLETELQKLYKIVSMGLSVKETHMLIRETVKNNSSLYYKLYETPNPIYDWAVANKDEITKHFAVRHPD